MTDRKDGESPTTVDFYFRKRDASRGETLRRSLKRDGFIFVKRHKKREETPGGPSTRVSPRFKTLALEEIEKRREALMWLADR